MIYTRVFILSEYLDAEPKPATLQNSYVTTMHLDNVISAALLIGSRHHSIWTEREKKGETSQCQQHSLALNLTLVRQKLATEHFAQLRYTLMT